MSRDNWEIENWARDLRGRFWRKMLADCYARLRLVAGGFHPPAGVEVETLVQQLQRGGYVLLFRHERTNAFKSDQVDYQISDCTTQRNLSMGGAACAEEVGQIIRHLGIPIGTVLASPMCRTMDTARRLFGDARPAPDLWMQDQQAEGCRTVLCRLIRNTIVDGTNVAMITHAAMYRCAFEGQLGEGDAAIVAIVGEEPRVVGMIASNAWNELLITANRHEKPRDERSGRASPGV